MQIETKYNWCDITVIIPAYNEEAAIGNTLESLIKYRPEIKTIVVDDGSTDRTYEIASQFKNVLVLRHELNRGYGASLKTGMRKVETPILAWYDSDGQHRPEDLCRILKPLMDGEADASIGARDKNSAFVAKRVPGKALLRLISQFVARQKIPDLNCGLRAFRTTVMNSYLHLLPAGFSASSTTTLLMVKRGYDVKFITITASPRVGHSTVRMRDGFRTMGILWRVLILFDAFWVFFMLSITQIIPGALYSIYLAQRQGLGFPVLGATVITSGIITFGLGILSQQINEMRQERFEANRSFR